MSTLNLRFMGGWGNQLFSYCFARAYVERHQLELRTDPWAGEKIFELEHPRCIDGLQRVSEVELLMHPDRQPAYGFEIRSYFQQQAALIYTRTQVREWLKIRPEIENILFYKMPGDPATWQRVAAHLRRGDYAGYGYALPSRISYEHTAAKFHLCAALDQIDWVSEETQRVIPELGDDLRFLPDFYRLQTADTLLRANSTFSWWASVLSLSPRHRVFSPIIHGQPGGVEADCEFVEGNWPRFADFDFTTDLHLAP